MTFPLVVLFTYWLVLPVLLLCHVKGVDKIRWTVLHHAQGSHSSTENLIRKCIIRIFKPCEPHINTLLFLLHSVELILNTGDTKWNAVWDVSLTQCPCNLTRARPQGFLLLLTHWGRVTNMCVSKLTIIGSDNGLSPDERQAVIWTNAGV